MKLAGRDYTRACWADVLRTALAVAIASAILFGLIWWVGDAGQTVSLESWFPILGVVFGVETLWAISYTLWPKKAPAPVA